MEIRQIAREEIESVLQLIDEYDRPKSPWPDKDEICKIYSAIHNSGGCVVGAFENNTLLGTCTVNICQNLSWSGRPFAVIENVIVSAPYRGKGIGKAILDFAKRHAQGNGCFKVVLMTGPKNPATLKFYESNGFMGNKIGYQYRFNA